MVKRCVGHPNPSVYKLLKFPSIYLNKSLFSKLWLITNIYLFLFIYLCETYKFISESFLAIVSLNGFKKHWLHLFWMVFVLHFCLFSLDISFVSISYFLCIYCNDFSPQIIKIELFYPLRWYSIYWFIIMPF